MKGLSCYPFPMKGIIMPGKCTSDQSRTPVRPRGIEPRYQRRLSSVGPFLRLWPLKMALEDEACEIRLSGRCPGYKRMPHGTSFLHP
jgi:hypothetical protein